MWLGPPIKPGSLLKQPGPAKKRRGRPVAPGQRAPREHDEAYLGLIRQLPCLICLGQAEAAHVRFSTPDRPNPGVGRKPHDRDTVPLCPDHHRNGPECQHAIGERKFWTKHGIDPFKIITRLRAAAPDLEAMRAVVHTARSISTKTDEASENG